MVEVAKHREIVSGGVAKLRAAEELVTRDAEVLRGEPCIRNTRIPVYLVAALATQRGRDKARATYPSLTRDEIELAVPYAKANPRKGRPRTKLLTPRPEAPFAAALWGAPSIRSGVVRPILRRPSRAPRAVPH